MDLRICRRLVPILVALIDVAAVFLPSHVEGAGGSRAGRGAPAPVMPSRGGLAGSGQQSSSA
jgi:hypothetical protein